MDFLRWLVIILFSAAVFGDRDKSKRKKKKSKNCGLSKTGFGSNFHIYLGEDAQPNQWPWMVAIEKQQVAGFDMYSQECAGAILQDGLILTAAHCFPFVQLDVSLYRVKMGEQVKIVNGEKQITSQYKNVKDVIIHEWFLENQEDDIALVVLEDNVTFSDQIRPICEPPSKRNEAWLHQQIEEGKVQCVIAGWGVTELGVRSETLKYTYTDILSPDVCTSQLGPENYNKTRNFCTQNKDNPLKDSCKADSGGPVLCRLRKHKRFQPHWYVFGIISWGEPCGPSDPNTTKPPGIATNLFHYKDWLKDTRALIRMLYNDKKR